MNRMELYCYWEIKAFGYGVAVLFNPRFRPQLLGGKARFRFGRVTILRPPKLLMAGEGDYCQEDSVRTKAPPTIQPRRRP